VIGTGEVKDDHAGEDKTLEILRLVVPVGKEIATHRVEGEITLQCLEGELAFWSMGKPVFLDAGQLLYLSAKEPHGVRGIEDASVLVRILLHGRPKP
jgi:quercetin dioxygenase-like cupin family protein